MPVPSSGSPSPRRLTRRGAIAALGATALLPLATSCRGDGGSAGNGGRLRAAFPSGGTETLDPHVSSVFLEQARAKALFDTVVAYDDDMALVPRLAESWGSDDSGTRWTIHLREAHFHDGDPVTADDVLYSFRRISDEETASPARPHFTGIDFEQSRAVSETELELVLDEPNFVFPFAWGAPAAEIVPAGTTDFSAPVGSGPFRFVSFEPGESAVFERFEDYWDGAPRTEELEFVPMEEESARVNALLSGQVHYADDVSANSATQLQEDGRASVLTAPHGTMQAIVLKVDREPFDDPRILEAVQLGVDREALVEVALAGYGQVGNDLFGQGLQHYPQDLPERERDVERARSLLEEAGAEGLSFQLDTSAADPYFESAATLVAEQLSEIGMEVETRVRSAETYFADIEEEGVAAHIRTAPLPIVHFLGQRLRGGADSNQTRYESSEFDRLYAEAVATADDGERAELLEELQHLARDESGLLVWGFSNWNVGVSTELQGMREAPPNSVDWARFERAALQ